MDLKTAAQILYGWTPEKVEQVLAEPSKEEILIDGQPATPELWSAWERWIGADRESQKATMEAYEASKKLAKELQEQEWERMSTRE